MTTHSGVLGHLAPYVVALLLVIVTPLNAAAQTPSRDTTTATAGVKDLPLTPAQRQAFVGTYRVSLPHGEERTARIFEENGVLKLHPSDAEPARLLYQGNNVFHPEGMPDFVFTFTVENGRATKFTVRREDGVMVGVRLP
jgi:hypothetical protein